ncbi:MAG: Fur family transcriptional regulator [Nannocystales bacterium]
MAKLSREEARRALHDAGMRATAPRVAVFRLLTDATRPLSHAEVVERIGTDDWDAATLYRNLIKLDEAGLARVASRVGGVTRFEAYGGDAPAHVHPHFACRECGNVTCLHDATLSIPKDDVWREALLDADLQVVGQCPSCRKPARKTKTGRKRKGV